MPCNTHGPCTTRFGDADLITRRVRTAYCEKLNDMIDVIELLQGVPGRNAELRSIVRDVVRSELTPPLVDSQRQMMKEITKIRIKQDDRCPSVFTVTKAAKAPGHKFFTLRLYCGEPASWHPLPDDAGCYEIAGQSEWLRKAGPWIARTLELLKVAFHLPAHHGIAARELSERISDDIALTWALLNEIGYFVTSGDPAIGLDAHGPVSWADTDADFRTLRRMLTELDHDERRGGLSDYTTPEDVRVYFCAYHLDTYNGPPKVPGE